jgi:asparagine synthase (glutamine-hydrolysing)
MCGIAGIYAYHYAANAVDRAELRRIRDHMAARGPDGFGEWYSEHGRVGFGHRRLSIIDLSERGSQPMASADGKLIVTFNGEIYNYRELRAGLENTGHAFRTETDTEVLLHLYADKGEAMVEDLRGMFAFGLWDSEKSSLLLARDPYGIKPLYYADDGWTLRFASQVKALLAGGAVSPAQEPAGWVGFCLFGSVPEPFTTYQEIRALPAGSTLWVDRIGRRAARPYFSIADAYCRAEAVRSPARDAEVEARVREALLDSVHHHLVADVPVGAFLSSGIDSGALVGLMRDAGARDIETVTLAFEEFRGRREDEAPLAAEVAARYGTRHTTRYVAEQEFRDDLPKILDAMDQPTIDGLNTWFVAKAARELGLKVAISGLGGDELFGGYPSFRDVPSWVRALAVPAAVPGLGELARGLFAGLRPLSRLLNPKAAGLLKYGGSYAGAYLLRRGLFMPWELEPLLGRDTVRLGLRRLAPLGHIAARIEPKPRTSLGRVAALESSLYMRNQLLRDTDWASMAHSLEVRVPLVDAQLLRKVVPAVTAAKPPGKRMLANSPSLPLPAKVIARGKTGFTTPIETWLERDKRIERWRQVPALAADTCAWARRWAFQVAAVQHGNPPLEGEGRHASGAPGWGEPHVNRLRFTPPRSLRVATLPLQGRVGARGSSSDPKYRSKT